MNIDIRFPSKKEVIPPDGRAHIVTPAETITSESGFMRGHGTYAEDESLVASVAGVVDIVNKLISVRPLRTRYNPEVGDVVVGRVTEVAQKKWKVDTNSRLDSVLMLSAVNLPGNVLRRRQAEDELLMREYFVEHDVIAAEVQSLYADGACALHRVKFGSKLKYGTFVSVQSALIKRTKTQSHVLPCGVLVILGNNGYCWVGPPPPDDASGGPADADEDIRAACSAISTDMRENIARVRNAIAALHAQFILISDTSVMYAYEASLKYPVSQMLKPEVQDEITQEARALTA